MADDARPPACRSHRFFGNYHSPRATNDFTLQWMKTVALDRHEYDQLFTEHYHWTQRRGNFVQLVFQQRWIRGASEILSVLPFDCETTVFTCRIRRIVGRLAVFVSSTHRLMGSCWSTGQSNTQITITKILLHHNTYGLPFWTKHLKLTETIKISFQ